MDRTQTVTAMLFTLGLAACSDPNEPAPVPVSPIATTSGGEGDSGDEGSLVSDPPTSTLRAPADDRREEVDSETGLPPVQAQ